MESWNGGSQAVDALFDTMDKDNAIYSFSMRSLQTEVVFKLNSIGKAQIEKDITSLLSRLWKKIPLSKLSPLTIPLWKIPPLKTPLLKKIHP